jgi:hypothetical protein
MAGGAEGIQRRYQDLSPVLNEQGRRRFAATEARAYGHGGVSVVSLITGLARSTIGRGIKEIEEGLQLEAGRVRKPGGGRKAKQTEDSTLLSDLQRIVEPATRGDPMRVLQWTSKSLRHLSEALKGESHSVCPHVIADCLRELGYSLQANRKTQEGSSHMDRDAQFQYISDQAKAFLAAHEPVISVDTKKKELVGNFKNDGREWRPKASPEAVNVHDFIDPKLGRAIPYGVYDIGDNKGWVSVGADHDTASFAVHAIGRWWRTMGKKRYPKATRLLLPWRLELHHIAGNEMKLLFMHSALALILALFKSGLAGSGQNWNEGPKSRPILFWQEDMDAFGFRLGQKTFMSSLNSRRRISMRIMNSLVTSEMF